MSAPDQSPILSNEILPNDAPKSARNRRRIAVLASIAATVSFAIIYIVGDIYDVLPGALSLQSEHHRAIPAAPSSIEAGIIAGKVDADIAVDANQAQQLVDALKSTDGIGDVAVSLTDGKGEAIVEYNADTAYEPASTLKTLTALAASTTLDMSATLDTQTYLIQHDDGLATLVLKGNGDMLLGSGDSDASHVNGRAGLGTLAERTAQALAQRGIDTVRLQYDDSLFGENRWPEAMELVDPDHVYYTPVSSMAVDGGRHWGGSGPANPDSFSSYPPLTTQPAAEAASTFAERLQENGITIEGDISTAATPDGISPIASVSSAQFNEILAFALRQSDNTIAEEFGRLTALATGDDNSPQGATQAVMSRLNKLGIDITGLSMGDCSGLTVGSRVTVRTLTDVQTYNLTAGSGAAAGEGLSVSDLIGTAASRISDASIAGLIRAKTGSLDTVTSMCGNVTRTNGGVLSFAVIVNNPGDYNAARAAIDEFVSALPNL